MIKLFAYILVDVPAGAPRDLATRISRFKGVVEARSVYGSRYDIVVRAKMHSETGIYKITDRIQSLEKGILTETFEAKEE